MFGKIEIYDEERDNEATIKISFKNDLLNDSPSTQDLLNSLFVKLTEGFRGKCEQQNSRENIGADRAVQKICFSLTCEEIHFEHERKKKVNIGPHQASAFFDEVDDCLGKIKDAFLASAAVPPTAKKRKKTEDAVTSPRKKSAKRSLPLSAESVESVESVEAVGWVGLSSNAQRLTSAFSSCSS